jgi:hypothetical protein
MWSLGRTNAIYHDRPINPILYSIQVFSENDIWALGSWPFHWDGESWTMFHLADLGVIPAGIRGELWGVSSNDIYFVGANGRIVHYDGSAFEQIDVGVDTRFVDISGTPDGSQVFVVGYNFHVPVRTTLVQISEGNVNILYDALQRYDEI